MRIITFNANGIRSAADKGFFEWLKLVDPDVVCIQETKVQHHILAQEPFFPEGYFCQYVDAQKPGYSGVAIYAKKQPQNIVTSMDYSIADHEGRYLQFDFEGYSVVSMYLPSGSSSEQRQVIKFEFLDVLSQHLMRLKEQGRELILCGDYNIAHRKEDLKNWKTNQKNSGFLPEERAWMDELFGPFGFVDAFRIINQQTEQYTWWSYRFKAWEKNVGWRIDYQVITPGIRDAVKEVAIYTGDRFSDHAPVIIDYHGEYFA